MFIDFKSPLRLETSRAWRTYLGGKMISALHGEDGEDGQFPEEWLMSTVAARNAGREHIVEGITKIADTPLTLLDLIRKCPEQMLGASHVETHGNSLGVLVKLLDAAERLTIQCHPTREMAEKLFRSPFGKTECWHIIGEREVNGEKPCIYIGFKKGVTDKEWKRCFHEQDIPAMLNCLHRIEVKTGDTFIVRGGVPHCIGAGCFLVEIQEPTDYTIRTERVTPAGLEVADPMLHQGLGFKKMFRCFDYKGANLEKTLNMYRVQPKVRQEEGYTLSHVIYPEVTDMFALDLYEVTGKVTLSTRGRFSGLYVLSGKGKLGDKEIGTCDHYFLPAHCEDVILEGSKKEPLRIIRCFGPEN